ncbi:hypothetical protein [Epilithonimonas sp.]|uniref:hypothetical protein n=1 Tax=Epilithonimonas sp. TaxID=2894511 RepID=UPI0028A102AA|nr:hypothetical protein [Epilithonimonas sp.]
MEIPFYYSFKEFEANYYFDFQNWIKEFPDATEKDFLFALKELYEPFVRWSGKYHFKEIRKEIKLKNEPQDWMDSIGKHLNTKQELIDYISLEVLTKTIDRRFSNYFVWNQFFKEDFKDKTLVKILYDCEILDIVYGNEYKESIYGENDNFKINYRSIKNIEKFVFFNLERESNDELFFCFNEKRYKNFGFSVVRIAEWIDEKIKENKTSLTQPISIIDIYKPGLSQLYKVVRQQDNFNGNIYRNIESENDKLSSDLSNAELNQHKINFNTEFRYLISKFNDFFGNLYDYLEPKINTEKRNLQDYKDSRENNLNSLEIEIKKTFTNLNKFLLQLGIYKSESNFISAYQLRDYYKVRTELYKKFMEDYGIEIYKTPFKENFDNLISNIESSLNTDELKFINQLQNNQPNTITTDDIENDFSDSVPLERMIILEKLGIIKYIQSLQNDNNNEKQTAEILSSFTGIPSGTIAKNLGVMLGVKKNDAHKNSPYNNPKNLQLANSKFNQFNIDLTKILQ